MAPSGQRSDRMLASAARAGLFDNTHVFGLGDLGSGLPQAFDEAFHAYKHLYSGDWKHVRNYVDAAAAVLDGEPDGESDGKPDRDEWNKQMRDCIWNRDIVERDRLLGQADKYRVVTLPKECERCPVHALTKYVKNNWHRMNAKQLKDLDMDFVSARAEAQVRDRTKDRYSGPGAWHVDNLEGKAILRAIIAEGNWNTFRQWYLDRKATRFQQELYKRLDMAVAERRLSNEVINPHQKAA